MFDVYCQRHHGRVLLFPDNIESMVNTGESIEIHWRCSCGEVGVERVTREPAHVRPDAA